MITKRELLQKIENQESLIISLSQNLADALDRLDAYGERLAVAEGLIKGLENTVDHIDEHIQDVFDDVVAETAKQWSRGLEDVVNYTPFGVK